MKIFCLLSFLLLSAVAAKADVCDNTLALLENGINVEIDLKLKSLEHWSQDANVTLAGKIFHEKTAIHSRSADSKGYICRYLSTKDAAFKANQSYYRVSSNLYQYNDFFLDGAGSGKYFSFYGDYDEQAFEMHSENIASLLSEFGVTHFNTENPKTFMKELTSVWVGRASNSLAMPYGYTYKTPKSLNAYGVYNGKKYELFISGIRLSLD